MPPSTIELQVLQKVDFDWVFLLQSIWQNPELDVSDIHRSVRESFTKRIGRLIDSPRAGSPPGWFIVGPKGSGKTHLLATFRLECDLRECCFILIDMTDARDFWDTVSHGYLYSLLQPMSDGKPQYEKIIKTLFQQLKPDKPAVSYLAAIKNITSESALLALDRVYGAMRRKFPVEAMKYGNVIRALLALASSDFSLSSTAATWLMGEEIDQDARQKMGLSNLKERGATIVGGLTWLMGLGGFSVVAFDQLDTILPRLKEASGTPYEPGSPMTIDGLGAGLCELRDVAFRSQIIISCVEVSWRLLQDGCSAAFLDRYEQPVTLLKPVGSLELAESVYAGRLQEASRALDFNPPYASWPFKREWFETFKLTVPREILKHCNLHISECVRQGEVREAPPGWAVPIIVTPPIFQPLDDRFLALRDAVKVGEILADANEDTRFADLIRSAFRCLQKELDLPSDIDLAVDETFTGGKSNPPLHARVRLDIGADGTDEDHISLRALQKTHPNAFCSRLRSAMTVSGIDKSLDFRKLFLFRRNTFPSGAVSNKLLAQFQSLGGHWIEPTDDDIRTLEALRLMLVDGDPLLQDWLKVRQHASKTTMVKTSLASVFELISQNTGGAPKTRGAKVSQDVSTPQSKGSATVTQTNEPEIPKTSSTKTQAAGAETKAKSAVAQEPTVTQKSATPMPPLKQPPAVTPGSAGTSVQSPSPSPTSRPPGLPLGRKLLGNAPIATWTTMPFHALQKHGVIFAGAGSGKTVLLKRLIEEAAMDGIPSIVIDTANDLAQIGDPWALPPSAWVPGDAARADAFIQSTERIVWTPGKESGNPISLAPLPDLTALADNEEEFLEAVTLATDALAPVIATGSSTVATRKKAVLFNAIKFLGKNGQCDLKGLESVLQDFPDDATTRIRDEKKVAQTMADDLNAQVTTSPLLRASGPLLDPATLLAGTSGKTRISVVSLVGLSNDQAKRHFLNQLAMSLFSWIKKNPAQPGQLRGLFVIDEARDFIPSQRASECLASIQQLAAQARKYGLGLVIATQNPKDIDNKIVGQCSTQWYGKMNSPVAIEAAEDLLRARGSNHGGDIGRLTTGVFYVSNADHLTPPTKLATPFCLSAHSGPMSPEAVIAKAAACRQVGSS